MIEIHMTGHAGYSKTQITINNQYEVHILQKHNKINKTHAHFNKYEIKCTALLNNKTLKKTDVLNSWSRGTLTPGVPVIFL